MCPRGHCGISVALLLPERVIVIVTCCVLTLLVDVERSCMKKLVVFSIALVGLFVSPAALAEGERVPANTLKTGKMIVAGSYDIRGTNCPRAASAAAKALSDNTGGTKKAVG